MGSSWFLKLALKCIVHLAWPVLALGYPLCASVQAIETDSYTETRTLIAYWILLSVIYLVEYAFLSLLKWFPFWPYIKLMIIFWLVIPDFGRASYVYNLLIHSCISMKPQAVISRLKKRKKLFFEKENFVMQAERFIKENGTEALEELIASKINTKQNKTHNPDAKATNAIGAADKKEMQQTNEKRLQMEHEDIKDLEVIEKNETPAGKQGAPAKRDLALNESTSSALVENKGNVLVGKDAASAVLVPNLAVSQKTHNTASPVVENKGMVVIDAAGGGEVLQGPSTRVNMQKEWTCAMCQVTTTCEKNLNTHLQGRKHRAACEALKVKNQPVTLNFVPVSLEKRKNQSNEELKQKNFINQHANIVQESIQILQAKEHAQTNKEPQKSILNNDAVKLGVTKEKVNKSTGDQKGIHARANTTGRLKAKAKNAESVVNNGLKGKVVMDHKKVQELQNNLGKAVGMNHCKLRCEICGVNCNSEGGMASHLNGRKHLAQIQILSEAGVC